jgi:hypothetical protein
VVVVLLSLQAAIMSFFMICGGCGFDEALAMVKQHPVALPEDLREFAWVENLAFRCNQSPPKSCLSNMLFPSWVRSFEHFGSSPTFGFLFCEKSDADLGFVSRLTKHCLSNHMLLVLQLPVWLCCHCFASSAAEHF